MPILHQHGCGFTVSVDTGDSDWEIWVDVSLSEGGIKVEVRRNDESLGLEDDLMASEFEAVSYTHLTLPTILRV